MGPIERIKRLARRLKDSELETQDDVLRAI